MDYHAEILAAKFSIALDKIVYILEKQNNFNKRTSLLIMLAGLSAVTITAQMKVYRCELKKIKKELDEIKSKGV